MVECKYRYTDELKDTICVNGESENVTEYVDEETCRRCEDREPQEVENE